MDGLEILKENVLKFSDSLQKAGISGKEFLKSFSKKNHYLKVIILLK